MRTTRHCALAAIPALVAILAVAACSDDDDVGPASPDTSADAPDATDAPDPDASEASDVDAGPTYDEEACSEFAVPTGMGLRWANANHRISLWEFRLAGDGASCAADRVEVSYVGGDWTTGEIVTDVPTARGSVVPVRGTAEAVGAAPVSVTFDLEPPGTGTTSVRVDRAEAGLLGYRHASAVITGVRLETDVPQGDAYPEDYEARFGYTSRGFGVAAEVGAVDDQTIEVDVGVRFEHGAADRENMNRAMQVARTRAVVDLLVVGSTSPIVEGEIDYRLEYEKQTFGVDPDHPHADEETRRLLLSGRPDGPAGVVAFGAFDFALSTHGECGPRQECPRGETCGDGVCTERYGPAGVYVRELSAAASVEAYDPATGELSVLVDGYASNASGALAFFALRHDFSARVVWLQVPTGEPVRIEQEFDTGAVEIPL